MRFNKLLLTLFSFILVSAAVYAAGITNAGDKSDIEQTINAYVKSIDSQNADALQKSLMNDGSVITINSITKTINNYTASQFIGLVKNRQKGGWTRNVTIGSVSIDGNTATAQVEISDSRLVQSGFFTLIKEGNDWKIASDVTTLELKK